MALSAGGARMSFPSGHIFEGLQPNGYGAILADPPWQFNSLWGGRPKKVGDNYPSRAIDSHYDTLTIDDISAFPVNELAAPDCVLFMWTCWPVLAKSFAVLQAWGFEYKTCGFCWMKARADQVEMFDDTIEASMGMGYWTRANSEVCLLATKGSPKRLNADVKQGIISPRREHSRKPEGIHHRIERLVAGPYCELFARTRRAGWDVFGNEIDKFAGAA